MSAHKSVIESQDVESTGQTFYVQNSGTGNLVVLSFDGNSASYGVTITKEEAKAYAELLNKALEQM